MSKRTASPGLGALGTGAVTALALAVQTGLAAVVGVIVAREFGRSAETDGFFAAYGVFVVVVLAANAIRVAVLPPLARAATERRLGAETAAYAVTLATVAVPLLVVALAAAGPISWLLTGDGPRLARETAAAALPWMVAAALLQLYAGLAASALAALDDYAVPALGFAAGSVVGLAYILERVDAEGIEAVAHAMTLNGVIACALPAAALAARAARAGMPASAVRPGGRSFRGRVAEMGSAVALPLALQAIYVVCLPFAGREGVGATTSFGYAYLIASAVVAVTASSLGLVTAVPLMRSGLDPGRAARHVVASSWLAVVVLGATAGVFGLAGGSIVRALLGSHYGGGVGPVLGRLVVVLSLWAVASVGVSVAFPLVFVSRRAARLPLLAAAVVAVHVPLALAGQVAAGLDGLALALAATTGIVFVALLARLQALSGALRGLGVAAGFVAVVAALAFGPVRFLAEPVAAAGVGLGVYALLLALVRPAGLTHAWHYLRALG